MRVKRFWVGMLLGIFLAAGHVPLSAAPPTDTPPRGKAFGYFLKDGERVLFVYVEEDGSRRIELSQCRQNRRYLIQRSADLESWTPLIEVQADAEGKALAVDTDVSTHYFYTVSRVR